MYPRMMSALMPLAMPNRWSMMVLAICIALGATSIANAQPKPKERKLYCWDEGGRRVCSDALPASAVGRQRTEFDTRTGTSVNRMGREMTPEERLRAAAEDESRQADAQRARREMAMVVSYDNEEDLKRSFTDRFELVEESLKGSELALVGLHASLLNLLRQANALELESKPVGKVLRNKILTQHAELQGVRALKQRQQTERAALNAEFQEVLSRYRLLKNPQNGGAPAATAPSAGG